VNRTRANRCQKSAGGYEENGEGGRTSTRSTSSSSVFSFVFSFFATFFTFLMGLLAFFSSLRFLAIVLPPLP
jgi:hypothetical protein